MHTRKIGFLTASVALVGSMSCTRPTSTCSEGRAECPSSPIVAPEPTPREGLVCSAEENRRLPCALLCPETRRVGPCPADEVALRQTQRQWTVEPLLGSSARSSRLSRYCTYDWRSEGAGPSATDLPAGSERDCAVAVQAMDVDLTPLHQSFLMETGVAHVGGLPIPPPATQRVMVAVVDTHPNLQEPEGGFHGEAMASIVHDVACGAQAEGACPVSVSSFLGLEHKLLETAGSGIGFAGTQSELAASIVGALAAWDEVKPRGVQHLVINLSVGWETACDPAGAEVVEVALQEAAEEGALVFAASGNLPVGSCVSGPLGPAAWEAGIGAEQQPLVHGVTPVDDAHRDLLDHRPESNARLAALGAGAVFGGRSISGSSVSTAVVSAIAARVWSEQPGLEPEEVVGLMWASGLPRDTQADVYFGGQASEQRVVSACRAVECARTWTGSSCGVSYCPVPNGDAGQAWLQAVSQVQAQALTAPGGAVSLPCDTCGGAPALLWPAGDPRPLSPWVHPQPDVPVCSSCGITEDTALLRLDEEFTEVVDVVTFTLENESDESAVYSYQGLSLSNSAWYLLENEDFSHVNGQPTVTGYIGITFADPLSYSTGNSIYIEP